MEAKAEVVEPGSVELFVEGLHEKEQQTLEDVDYQPRSEVRDCKAKMD